MRKKKGIAILMVMAISLSVLAGCGNKDNQPSEPDRRTDPRHQRDGGKRCVLSGHSDSGGGGQCGLKQF